QAVNIAGRIMSRRIMGSASFIELQDSTGRIQVYIKRDDICPGEDKTLYNTVFKKLLDIGYIIGIKGFAFITQTGTISFNAQELKILLKSIKPMTIVKLADGKTFDAVNDNEFSYRQCYDDLVVTTHVQDTSVKVSTIQPAIRNL